MQETQNEQNKILGKYKLNIPDFFFLYSRNSLCFWTTVRTSLAKPTLSLITMYITLLKNDGPGSLAPETRLQGTGIHTSRAGFFILGIVQTPSEKLIKMGVSAAKSGKLPNKQHEAARKLLIQTPCSSQWLTGSRVLPRINSLWKVNVSWKLLSPAAYHSMRWMKNTHYMNK